MTRGRRARIVAGVGLLAMLFGALMTVAPGVGATEGDGAHAVDHNADLNPNQRGTTFQAASRGDCDDLPQEVTDDDFVWHFVTEGQDTFEQLNVEFQTDGSMTDVDFVAHPSAKHAYVSTTTRDTLFDATAPVQPGPEGDAVATFQLSHVCDFSEQPEEGAPTNALTVVKAVDADAPESWEFEFSGDLGTFPLSSATSERTFDGLADGEVSVAEAVHTTASLTGIECEATGGGETDFSVDGREVSVDLAGGEDVTCTFTNDFPPQVQGDREERETVVTVEVEAEQQTRTPEVDVRGDVQQRTALPRTGSTSQTLSFAGIGLVLAGAAMVGGSRRRLTRTA